jgi:hypothetical protein
MRSSRSHTDEILEYQKGPLAYAIYLATRNICIFKDVPGAGDSAVDWKRTMALRAEVEQRIRAEWAKQPTPEPDKEL